MIDISKTDPDCDKKTKEPPFVHTCLCMNGFMPTNDATKCKTDVNYVPEEHNVEIVVPDDNTGTCVDTADWISSSGAGCDDYTASGWCNDDGSPGDGWDPLYGSFQEWSDEAGVDATQACCTCGGGGGADAAPADDATDIFHFEDDGAPAEDDGAVSAGSYGVDATMDSFSGGVDEAEAAPVEEEAAPVEEAPACADADGWISSTDFTCADYATYNWCNADGSFGEGWDPELGEFSDWGSTADVTDATQSCCVCGGGSSGAADPAEAIEVAEAAPVEEEEASYAEEEAASTDGDGSTDGASYAPEEALEVADAAPVEEAPVEEEAPAEEAAVCVDMEGWESSSGFACDEYASSDWCKDGDVSAGWDEAFGTFADWATDGVDATSACCVCGRLNNGESWISRRSLRGNKH